MNSKRITLYAALLFFSGAILGAVCFHVAMRFRMARGFDRDPAEMNKMIVRRLDSELDLSDEQRERIVPIVEEMQQKLQAVRRESRPRIEEILDEATLQAETGLSAEQRVRLHELENRVKARFGGGPGQ